MSKKSIWIQSLVFLAFIGVFFVLNLILPDKTFSQQENRTLQTAPKFSFDSFVFGNFTTEFEDYVTDQFAFRDRWTSLKARAELFTGKDSNNGVFLCENETLLECYEAPSQNDLEFKLDSINSLADREDADVYLALIPSASEIWSEKLPEGAENDSQKDVIDHSYAYTTAIPVDVYSALEEHKDEKIFYRTDHHWTTLGAYYGYTAVVEAMGMTPLPLSDYYETVVSEDFLGTVFSSSGFSWVEPETMSTYVEQGDAVVTNYPQGSAVEGSLYVESFLEAKDKYSYFFGGNTPLLEIDTGKKDAPSLLILRDSYMDSMSPYLFEHFSKISIVDLRYYKTSLKAYIESNSFDDILVCYSVPNLSVDDRIFFAAY